MCLTRSMPDASAGFLLLHVACTRVYMYVVGASAWAAADVALLYEPQVARARALLAIRSNRRGAKEELRYVTVRKRNETKRNEKEDRVGTDWIGSDRIGSRAISHTNRLLAVCRDITDGGVTPQPQPRPRPHHTHTLTSHTFGTFV